MVLGFTKDDLVGDVAEWMRAEQGNGFKKTLLYDIEKKTGHPINTSVNWYDAKNLLGFYEWLTLVAAYGAPLASRSLNRISFRLTPLDSNMPDDAEFNLAMAEKLEAAAGDFRDRAAGVGNGGKK